jgi:hypothetical protein
MTFVSGFFVGLAAAWVPSLVILSYLAWRTSRDRAAVKTSSEATSQAPLAKVLGPLRPKPRTR